MVDPDKERDDLEAILNDASAEPMPLSYTMLSKITDNFSHVIGSGGFGVVYMGYLRNRKVALKKLSKTDEFSEKQFEDELTCLIGVKHENVVRLLGYCSDTQKVVVNIEGKSVLAEQRQRFLCFEYVPNKSLHDYLKDDSRGHEWDTHHQLILGICQGLRYLHNEHRINHLDLKPENILLDANMVPKITDFGLSRRFGGEQSRMITKNIFGTLGYVAPEYWNKGEISFKSDIYSLGIIIRKLLVGTLKSESENWHQLLNMECPQVNRCVKIAQLCVLGNPRMRPTTDYIIDMLSGKEVYPYYEQASSSSMLSSVDDEVESVDVSAVPSPLQLVTIEPKIPGERGDQIRYHNGPSKDGELLDVYPLELCFPFVPNKVIECPLALINRTDYDIAICITPICQEPCLHLCHPVPLVDDDNSLDDNPCRSFFKMMGPRSTRVVVMRMKEKWKPRPRDTSMFEVVVITDLRSMDLLKAAAGTRLNLDVTFMMILRRLSSGQVHRAVVTAIVCDPASCRDLIPNPKFIKHASMGHSFDLDCIIDVHPIETWILACSEGRISIFNYQNQKELLIKPFSVTRPRARGILSSFFRHTVAYVASAKFISQKHWFAVGDSDGWVHIYAYNNTKDTVKEFQACHGTGSVKSLAVHPTKPFLLTSGSSDNQIKLWDWAQDWRCIRRFDNGTDPTCIAWNPRGSDTFAAASRRDLKVWEIHSSDPATELEQGCYVDTCCFYGDSHQNFVATTAPGWSKEDPVIDIWGAAWGKPQWSLVHKLHLSDGRRESDPYHIRDVACHPTLPILVTLTTRTLCFWNARTYRLEKIYELKNEPLRGGMIFTGSVDLPRLVVGYYGGVAIVDINLPTLKTQA